MSGLLPAVPGYIQGVVGVRTNERGHSVITFQCQECGTCEDAAPWVTTRMLFCPVHDPLRGRDRLCPSCRTASLLAQGVTTARAAEIVRT